MSKQRSKSKGSHGAKAAHEVHATCRGCGKNIPLRKLTDLSEGVYPRTGICSSCTDGSGRSVERLRAQDETFRPMKKDSIES